MGKVPVVRQVWTIATIELRRAFFSRRAFWVYALALFPTAIFLGHAAHVKIRHASLSASPPARPGLIDSVRDLETDDAVLERLGHPASDRQWPGRRQVPQDAAGGATVHAVDPPVDARYVRLDVFRPNYARDAAARIFELEVYGDADRNLALGRPATGSSPCSPAEGPEKAFDGSGAGDPWCSREPRKFLEVDLGRTERVRRIVVRHAASGGLPEELNTRGFALAAGDDGKRFTTVVAMAGTRFSYETTRHRRVVYFDGKREAVFEFADGRLESRNVSPLRNFEEDRSIFAGVFQVFYLRLAVFFGCLGIFMNMFRGEILDRTLHFWFLAPARREVLLAGKYAAALAASSAIFAGGALLCFAVLLGSHEAAEVRAYLQGPGLGHAFWYLAAAVAGCIGYGSVFLTAGLIVRNPVIPAAALLGWESIHGFLPGPLQKLSILHYLQSLCPVPVPVDDSVPVLLRLLVVPAEPASRAGAVVGLLALSAAVLWVAAAAVRRMEVSYGAE